MKCLVIMHLPLSYKSNAGKTLASLLKYWDKNDICQIYLKDVYRDHELCSDFFLIDEQRMIKKLFDPNIVVGQEMTEDDVSASENTVQQKLDSNLKFVLSRLSLVMLLRNLAWKKDRWLNRNLDSWIDKVRPDVIILMPGYISGVMDCACYIADKRNIPIATFVTDDYYVRSFSVFPIRNLLNVVLNKSYRNLLSYSDLHYVIGERMAAVYEKEFACKHIPIMNSVDISCRFTERKWCAKELKFVYLGGIGLGRFSSICKLAEAIGELNALGYKVTFDLYCNGISRKEAYKFDLVPGCRYRGFVQGEELYKAMDEADVLVHIESFSRRYKKIIETAVSTKIPEYMNSGRLLFVFGPSYAESIRLVMKNKLGVGVTKNDKAMLKKLIVQLLERDGHYPMYIDLAKHYAKKHFSIEGNARLVYEQLHGIKRIADEGK